MKKILISIALLSGLVYGSSVIVGGSSGGGSGILTSINADATPDQLITGSNNISASTAAGTTTINGTLLAPKAGPTFTGTIGTALTASKVVTTDGSGNLSTGTVTVAQGGTGLATLTSGSVVVGAGTSTPTFVAPSTSGNVLTSNGSAWASTAPAAPSITYPLQSDTDSEAAPSFSRSTDTNTGLWFPGADALSLAAGGKEVYRSTLTGGNTITTISGDTADAIDYNYHNLYIGNAFTGGYIGVFRIAQSSTVGWKFGSDQAVWGNNSFTLGANDVAKFRIKNNTTTAAISGSRANTAATDAYNKPAILGGNLHSTVPAAASPTATGANTTETDMYTHTLNASVIAQAGDSVELDAVGQFANNANNKTIKAYYGGTEILTSGAQAFGTAAVSTWHIRMKCYEDAATTGNNQVCWAEFTTDDTTATSKTITKVVKTTATYTAANVIKVTGTNGTASASDIVCFAGGVDYKPSGE